MIRPLLCVASLALAVSSVSQVIAASPRYAITQLRAVAIATGTYANVYDINDNGLAVGSETRLSSTSPFAPLTSATRGLAWTTGVADATVLATPTGGLGTSAYAVNNAGQIVGKAYLNVGTATAMLGSASSTVLTPTGTISVDGINASGEIIGNTSAGGFVIRNGIVTPLQAGIYAATSGVRARGISDAGTIVGVGSNGSFSPRALQLSATAAPLEIVSGSASVEAINNLGVAAGYVEVARPGVITGTAATFANGVATLLGDIPRAGDTRPLGGVANDLNDRGDVVGTSGPATGSGVEQAPFLYRDGELLNLLSLIDGTLPAGFRPLGINNRGQIIGEVYVDHDSNSTTPRVAQPYRLDPIRAAGDANVDGVSDFADLRILAAAYNGTGAAFYETGDFNYDWRVDAADLKILAAAYATPATLQADLERLGLPSVPEPASLAAIAAVALLNVRRRVR